MASRRMSCFRMSSEKEDKQKLLHDLTKEAELHYSSAFNGMYKFMKVMKVVHDTKLYKINYNKFDDYVYDKFGIKRGKAYYWLDIVQYFGQYIEDRKEPIRVDITKLIKAISLIRQNKGNAEDWFHMAITCDDVSYETNIREAQGKLIKEQCPHKRTKFFTKCLDCYAWIEEA